MTSERTIGGEMEITFAMLAEGDDPLVWPDFGKPHHIRCDTGRSALKLALQDWKSRTGSNSKTVWIPYYLCHSVLNAICQSDCEVKFYDDYPGQHAWEKPPAPRADDLLLIVHYFGLRNQAALDWLAARQTRAFYVLEDCVQAPYTHGIGQMGDYTITSLRKWWPTPDGATMASNKPLPATKLECSNETFVSQRAMAKMVRAQAHDQAQYLRWVENSESCLEDAPPRHPSWLSCRLMANADPATASSRRRQNWQLLATALDSIATVTPVYSDLGEGEVPLAFPITVSVTVRSALRNYLRENRVFCPVHWPLHHQVPEKAQNLSSTLLSIPIDQRYDVSDMQHIAHLINKFFQRITSE
ncbi:hypothetical protein DBR44_03925 [Aquitalea sp. FJL05]|uniref:DegT/DnrJ/EryC1/StrS aminotransferase family protein n=1 Tax=Aquitalea sp. FJL05 TaxID=2153366 RepID=UPI000F5ACD4E|nr:DegT/DnrJ/EryC1/StrS aminotransferase family protein [Aquitalea sp. FJL05]RQO76835.1 hypothetical protein DBR44_03925 [Aquitalea sp. FJL05]